MVKTNGNFMFPDQKQTEAYLKTLSHRTIRKFWKFVESDDLRKYPSYLPYALKEVNIEGIGVLTARVFALAQKWKKGSLEASEFRSKIQHLSGSGSIDIFEKLSVFAQEELWNKKFGSAASLSCVERAYLKLLLQTNLPPNFCYSYYTKKLVLRTEIWEESRQKMIQQGSTLNLDSVSDDFSSTLKHLFSLEEMDYDLAYRNENCCFDFGSRARDSILMLRGLYGEKQIIDVFTWIYQGRVRVCLEEVIAVIESWQEFSQYPAEWIANAHGFKHFQTQGEASNEV